MDALWKFFRRRRRRGRRHRRRRPPGFGKWAIISFYYDFGASGVRGSIRLVFRVPLEPEFREVIVKQSNMNKESTTMHITKSNIKKELENIKDGQEQA